MLYDIKMGDNLFDFSERCRLCIEPKRLSIDIFSEEGRKIKLKSKINKNLPLKVSQSDGLPRQICYQCLYRLETWVSFKQLCVERDQVMKTWSQSFLDDASSVGGGTYNGGRSSAKKAKGEMSNPGSQTSHPCSRNSDGGDAALSSCNQIDDAKSDTSLWEVVKTDDSDRQEKETSEKVVSKFSIGGVNSDYHTSTGEEIVDWDEPKSQQFGKVQSTGSDSSQRLDDQSCPNMSYQPVGCISLKSTSLNSSPDSSAQKHVNSQEVLSADPPLKRKRGRPSKAFLQRERELKKNRDQDHILTSSSDMKLDLTTEIERKSICTVELEKELQTSVEKHQSVMMSEFFPLERDNGSGVTEVVMDDPDFGSMKFTLSIVSVESPESSPIQSESYKSYNYASSSGNVSLDSLHKEDFEGFESPICSNLLRPLFKDDEESVTNELPRSKSQADIRPLCSDDVLHVSMKRKRSSSASGDFRVNSGSDNVSLLDHDELPGDGIGLHPRVGKVESISKSFENLDILNGCLKHEIVYVEERNAYSDGELSESLNKRRRRKSLVPQEF